MGMFEEMLSGAGSQVGGGLDAVGDGVLGAVDNARTAVADTAAAATGAVVDGASAVADGAAAARDAVAEQVTATAHAVDVGVGHVANGIDVAASAVGSGAEHAGAFAVGLAGTPWAVATGQLDQFADFVKDGHASADKAMADSLERAAERADKGFFGSSLDAGRKIGMPEFRVHGTLDDVPNLDEGNERVARSLGVVSTLYEPHDAPATVGGAVKEFLDGLDEQARRNTELLSCSAADKGMEL